MDLKTGYLGGALALALTLASCAPGPSVREPSDTTPGDVAAEDPSGIEGSEESSDTQRYHGPVLSDDEVMSTLSCEVLGDEQLASLKMFGAFDRGARVEVTERDGVTWWVVVLERTNANGGVDARSAYLTSSEGLDDFSDGVWIEVTDSSWDDVDWDYDLLVRGQSAVMLAIETLSAIG